MLIFEVHVVLLLDQFDHLAEAVHIKLADEGGEPAVAKEVAKYLLLQLLRVLYQDLAIPVPG